MTQEPCPPQRSGSSTTSARIEQDPAHVREVASSIRVLGFCDPVLVGRDNELIDGEARYEAARQLGLDRIPCVRIEHLSKDEQRVLRLAVNRLAEKGQWDLDALKIEFEELIVIDAPIEITGFSPGEIDHVILGDGAEGLEEGPLEPNPSAAAVAKVGDVFQLGPHRIICGSATDPKALPATHTRRRSGSSRAHRRAL